MLQPARIIRHGSSCTALWLDEGIGHNRYVARLLMQGGPHRYHISLVTSIVDAVHVLEAQAFDIIVLDSAVSELDRAHAIAQLRTVGRLTPIVVLLDGRGAEEVQIQPDDGAAVCLDKTKTDPQTLLEAIEGLIGHLAKARTYGREARATRARFGA